MVSLAALWLPIVLSAILVFIAALIRELNLHLQCEVLRQRNGCVGAGDWCE